MVRTQNRDPLLHGVHVSIDQLVNLRLAASRLDLSSTRTPRTASTGGYFSRFRGRGMEFEESRTYLAGDDIRTMDWKVTARTGQPHTKVFREERERPVLMVVDFRSTMFFGTRVSFKSVTAAGATALLSWVAADRGDRVGALVFSDHQHDELRPAGGRTGVLRLLRVLVEKSKPPARVEYHSGSTKRDTGLDHALHRARRVARPGSLIFVLSDFYRLGTIAQHHLMRLGVHNDVVLCWITDPLESNPPPPGRYPVSDGVRRIVLETQALALIDAYRKRFESQSLLVQSLAGSHGITLITLSTAEDIVTGLQRGLAASHFDHSRHLSRQI
ncbi:MAG: DUF58 domain-containing protein [Gammaproteobacteria bacterium]|nr:DUF58 domain-containing protein [Gammaproteobacteria bacterium]